MSGKVGGKAPSGVVRRRDSLRPYARPSNDEKYIRSKIPNRYTSQFNRLLTDKLFRVFGDATSKLLLATHLSLEPLNESQLNDIISEMDNPNPKSRNYRLAELLWRNRNWDDPKSLEKAAVVIGQLGQIRADYPSDDIEFAKEAVGRLGVPGATRQSNPEDIMEAVFYAGDTPEMETMLLILGYALREHRTTQSGED